MLIDSGAPGSVVDSERIPVLEYLLQNFTELHLHQTITTAGLHQLDGVSTGTLHDLLYDSNGIQRREGVLAMVVPALGRHLFSTGSARGQGDTAVLPIQS